MCSLISQILNTVKQFPDYIAIGYWDINEQYKELTYRNIDLFSTKLTELISNKIKEKVCVGLYMEHNHFLLALVISLLKCGLPFIFLDTFTSDEIFKDIVDKAQIKWIITTKNKNQSILIKNSLYSASLLEDGNLHLYLWKNDVVANNDIVQTDVCFLVNTSGTTGNPKIVKVNSESIFSNINCLRKKFNLTEDDVIYFGTPLTFDPSMVELFLSLSTGCALLLPQLKAKLNSSLLLDVLFCNGKNSQLQVTILQMVPSLFLRWNTEQINFVLEKSTCRVLALGGERFPEHILKLNKSEYIRIFNLYGITEVSCWASVMDVTHINQDVFLGEPLDDTFLELRDEEGCKIENGRGELYIGSLTRICYLDNETDVSLIKPVFRRTGDIVEINKKGILYVARRDNIIKRFGCKVNLSEMENYIFNCTNVLNTCIWIENLNKLVIFIIIKEFNASMKKKILDKFRIKLLRSLPKHYSFDDIDIISNYPLSLNGKIDKKYLTKMYTDRHSDLTITNSKPPVQTFKEMLCKYFGWKIDHWEKYCNCSFFDAGGNSIMAIQFLSEFVDTIDIEFTADLTTLFLDHNFLECCNFVEKSFKNATPKKRITNSDKNCDESKPKYFKLENTVKIEIAWKYNLEACVDSSPKIINERLVGVGSFANIFVVLNFITGSLVSQTILPDSIESRCCTTSNYVYVGCYNGVLYCIEFLSGKVLWEYATGDRIKSSPFICLENKSIIFGSYDKHVYCLLQDDGSLKWKVNVDGAVTSDTIVHEKKVYVATISGICICLSLHNGNLIWKCDIGVPVFGSPCIPKTNTQILWGDVIGKCHSFSLETGNSQWQFEAGGNIYSSIIAYEDFILFGCYDRNVYCLKISDYDYNLVYKISVDSPVYSTPQILNYKQQCYIIVVSSQGYIYLCNFDNGSLEAKLPMNSEIFSTPAVNNNKIIVGSRDNNLYCISIQVDK